MVSPTELSRLVRSVDELINGVRVDPELSDEDAWLVKEQLEICIRKLDELRARLERRP